MAAPAHTPRTTPSGYKMPEGYKSVLAFSKKPAIQLWERDLKPPSLDGGEVINTTTQHNITVETFYPRKLYKYDDLNMVCGYDPDVTSDLIGQINVNQAMSFFWPDGSYIDFFGVMRKADFAEQKIGEFPTVTVTISVTNTDDTNATLMVEAAPVFHAATGT